jgi:hypothetical protein
MPNLKQPCEVVQAELPEDNQKEANSKSRPFLKRKTQAIKPAKINW